MKSSTRFPWIQALLGLSLVFVLVLGGTTTAHAAEIITGEIIPASQTINDDAVIGGNTVAVDGTVNGNLVAGGETVTLNGTVNGDAILLGRTVIVTQSAKINGNLFLGAQVAEISGTVTGSLFGGSAAIELRSGASIAGNVYYGGYSFESMTGTTIGRDLLVGTYQTKVSGDITRNLLGGGAAFEINGVIGGDVKLQMGDQGTSGNPGPMFWNFNNQNLPQAVAPGLRFGPNAEIKGKLNYTSSVQQDVTIQPQGGVVFATPVPSQTTTEVKRTPNPTSDWGFGLLRNLATLLILGALALWLIPGLVKRSAGIVQAKTWPSMGIGFIAVALSIPVVLLAVGIVIALMLLFGLLSLGGMVGLIGGAGFTTIGVAIFAFSNIAIYAGKLAVAYLVGTLLFEKVFKAENVSPWVEFGIGILLVTLVVSIPLIGWFIGFLVVLVGLGMTWYLLRREPAAAVPATL